MSLKINQINKIKIGITFNIPKHLIDLIANGLNQNTLFLTELLLNIGYDIYLIVNDEPYLNSIDKNQILYDTRFKIIKHSDILQTDFDIMINAGFTLDSTIINQIKNKNTKIIGFFCGNSYINDTEIIIYNKTGNSSTQHFLNYINKDNRVPIFDEIWSIPQMYNTNKYYWQTLHRCKCIETPFIWSNKIIELFQKTDSSITTYINRGSIKTISVFEPNLSIMKSCIPPLLICENSYRVNKKLINRVFLTNIILGEYKEHGFNINAFNEFIQQFDLHHDNKLSAEPRYNALNFMSKHADIVVSHQWENNLNYLYFDMAWMGYPIIHNGSLCKDIGYYYEGFNYEMASDVLNDVLINHDKNYISYMEKNRQLLDRYFPSNMDLQNKFKNIITTLLSNK